MDKHPTFIPEDCLLLSEDPRIGDPFADDFCLDCSEPSAIHSLRREHDKKEGSETRSQEARRENLDTEPAILPAMPGCDSDGAKQMLERAARDLLQDGDEAVTAEVVRRASGIFQALVQPANPCSTSARTLHAASERAPSKDKPRLSVERQLKCLEFEAAVLRRQAQTLKTGSTAAGTWLCAKQGSRIGKASGKATRCKTLKSREFGVASVAPTLKYEPQAVASPLLLPLNIDISAEAGPTGFPPSWRY